MTSREIGDSLDAWMYVDNHTGGCEYLRMGKGWEKDEDHEEGQNNVRNKNDEYRHQSI